MTHQLRQSRRALDYEMLILVPILFLLLLANVQGLLGHFSSGEAGMLELVQRVLTTCFYLLLVVLLLVRRPAKQTTTSWVATIAASVGSFLPFALILNTAPGLSARPLTLVSILLMLVGLAFSIYALSWLGRSFGAVPAARRLVRNRPYGVVRHPL